MPKSLVNTKSFLKKVWEKVWEKGGYTGKSTVNLQFAAHTDCQTRSFAPFC